jgi:predicted NAD/FAD-binding protein
VTIFEKDATCGGHTLTDDSAPVPVDLGFQVFNFTNYPNLVGFLGCLGVDSEPSDMSFALSVGTPLSTPLRPARCEERERRFESTGVWFAVR